MTRRRFGSFRIRTPEGIDFALPLAGPFSRFLAVLTDIGLIGGLIMTVNLKLAPLAVAGSDFLTALVVLGNYLVFTVYWMAMEWCWRGQTIGKRLLRIRVMDEEGLRLQFSQVMIRNLLRVVDMFPAFYLAGGVACLLGRRRQRLGDIAAGTIVVRISGSAIPDMEKLAGHKYNSLRDHPQSSARLRRKVTGGEASIAIRALLQRDRMAPDARFRLFAELASHFRQLESFPPEVYEGITDERQVQNVLDVVYNASGPGLPNGRGTAGGATGNGCRQSGGETDMY